MLFTQSSLVMQHRYLKQPSLSPKTKPLEDEIQDVGQTGGMFSELYSSEMIPLVTMTGNQACPQIEGLWE